MNNVLRWTLPAKLVQLFSEFPPQRGVCHKYLKVWQGTLSENWRECAILLSVPALCNLTAWTANSNHSFIFANNQKALVTLSNPLSHSFPHLSCFQAKSSQKTQRQERKWEDAVLIDSHSHMRMDQCLDLSGPWRQHPLMCTTFLYIQTHLNFTERESSKKIKWSAKEKGGWEGKGRLFSFLLYLHHEQNLRGLINALTLALQEPPPFRSFPVLGKSFFTRGKLVFSSQNLAPGTFSKCNFGGRRVKSQYGFP